MGWLKIDFPLELWIPLIHSIPIMYDTMGSKVDCETLSPKKRPKTEILADIILDDWLQRWLGPQIWKVLALLISFHETNCLSNSFIILYTISWLFKFYYSCHTAMNGLCPKHMLTSKWHKFDMWSSPQKFLECRNRKQGTLLQSTSHLVVGWWKLEPSLKRHGKNIARMANAVTITLYSKVTM